MGSKKKASMAPVYTGKTKRDSAGNLIKPTDPGPRLINPGRGDQAASDYFRRHPSKRSGQAQGQFRADLKAYQSAKVQEAKVATDITTLKQNKPGGAGTKRPRSGLSRQGVRTGGRSSLNIRG